MFGGVEKWLSFCLIGWLQRGTHDVSSYDLFANWMPLINDQVSLLFI